MRIAVPGSPNRGADVSVAARGRMDLAHRPRSRPADKTEEAREHCSLCAEGGRYQR
jgi:hypothetical protein